MSTPRTFCHFASLSPVGRLSASALQTLSSAASIHPLSFLQDMAMRYVGCGVEKPPVWLSPVEPVQCRGIAPVQPQCSRTVARHDTDSTACRIWLPWFSIVLGLGTGTPSTETATNLSLSQWSDRTKFMCFYVGKVHSLFAYF